MRGPCGGVYTVGFLRSTDSVHAGGKVYVDKDGIRVSWEINKGYNSPHMILLGTCNYNLIPSLHQSIREHSRSNFCQLPPAG